LWSLALPTQIRKADSFAGNADGSFACERTSGVNSIKRFRSDAEILASLRDMHTHCIVMMVGEYALAHCDNCLSLSDADAKS
jgi:hypothetical protein